MEKKVLIAVNFIGFVNFLWDDIDILNNLGYKITLIGDNSIKGNDALTYLEKKNVRLIDAKIESKSPISKDNFKLFSKYIKLLKKEHFDLIHCHTPIVGLYMRLAAGICKMSGTKVIYTTHGLAYTHLSSKKEYLKFHSIESFASRLCDAIITINLEDYNNARKLHCKNVYHINGVGVNISRYRDITIDKTKYREKLGIPDDKILILSIGELSERKNHIVIIKALSLLSDKSKYIYAICGGKIAGDGTGDTILKLANEKGVAVKLLGYRSDIPEIVHCADIGAIPSIREGLGLAGIETLSAGIPLVGSDVQGIREYIIDGKTGFLCNPYDVKSFAIAIDRLSIKEYRESLKDNCLNIVKKFDKKKSISQREKIYKELLAQK